MPPALIDRLHNKIPVAAELDLVQQFKRVRAARDQRKRGQYDSNELVDPDVNRGLRSDLERMSWGGGGGSMGPFGSREGSETKPAGDRHDQHGARGGGKAEPLAAGRQHGAERQRTRALAHEQGQGERRNRGAPCLRQRFRRTGLQHAVEHVERQSDQDLHGCGHGPVRRQGHARQSCGDPGAAQHQQVALAEAPHQAAGKAGVSKRSDPETGNDQVGRRGVQAEFVIRKAPT